MLPACAQGVLLLPMIVQIAFTRSLSNQLVSKGIRVNAVAPGPIWTPLQAATVSKVCREEPRLYVF